MTSETGEVRYRNVTVRLTHYDGNAIQIIGRVAKALRAAVVPDAEIVEFSREAMNGDYDHVLATVQRWVRVL